MIGPTGLVVYWSAYAAAVLALSAGWAWAAWRGGWMRPIFSSPRAGGGGREGGGSPAHHPPPRPSPALAGEGEKPDSQGRGWRAAMVILVVAAGARVGLVLMNPPMLSDDAWRYIHDGRTLLAGQNPYALAPAEAPPSAITQRINNPHLVTIYQPVSQLAFAGAAWLGRWTGPIMGVRLVMVGLDMLTIAGILLLLRGEGWSSWWAVLYAWHPLTITEVAMSGHQDAIGIALLVGALLAAERCGRPGRGWAWLPGAGIALAGAIAVKPVIAPVALPLVWHLHRRGVSWVWLGAASGVGLAALAVLYLPFALMPGGLGGMLDTAYTFADQWAFNGSAFPVVNTLLGHKTVTKALAGAVVLGALVFGTARGDRPAAEVGLFMLAALLVSSTVHPWYVLWVLAVLPMWPSVTGWVLAGTVTLAYTAILNPAGFTVLPWAWAAEYGAVYAVLGVEAWVWWKRSGRSPRRLRQRGA